MDDVLVARADGVVTVTLNRPERKNSVTLPMMDALYAVLDEVSRNTADRVLVLTGAGDGFCSGMDISAMGNDSVNTVRRAGGLSVALHSLPKPTITALNGVAAGFGANLALSSDLVVAAESARLIQIFVKRALSLDGGGSWLLPKLVGLQKAKELAFFGEPVSAAEALEIGLATKVVPDDQLAKVTAEWAARLAAGPPLALALTKAMLNESGTVSMPEAVNREFAAQLASSSTRDFKEAIQAFKDKRTPNFEGR